MPDFGRVFLMVKYTDITQNTYVQSWTVMELMARGKCGLLEGPFTIAISWQMLSVFVLGCGVMSLDTRSGKWFRMLLAMLCQSLPVYSAWNPKDNYNIREIYCIVSCYIRLTLNICYFVHQCNTFTSYFLLIVDMFRPHTAIFKCYSILSRSWCSVMPIFAYMMLPAMC
jgi:hypothetical protein